MGFAFERWCRRNELLIARRLGFGGIVDYASGAWFAQDAAQIDLMFIRKDSKLICCEIKYNNESTLTKQVLRDMQTKADQFLKINPRYARYTIETALITTEPAPAALQREGYFTYLIVSDDLMAEI